MEQLSLLFHPQRVAIIGISRSTPSLGRMILDNLEQSGYEGEIFLVNPRAETIGSYKVHNNIESIPGELDLAIILTPPHFVPQTLELLAGRCSYVSIITAGFDKSLTERILELAESSGIRIVGPNSMGTYAPTASASFSPIPISPGSLAYISQSGSIIAVVQELMIGKFGFSRFISLGNKIDITEIDVLPHFAADPTTSVVAGYLESFSRPRELRKKLLEITPSKPVILVKGGRTDEGSDAVTSHTGALAGNFRLTRSLLEYCGAIVVNTIEEQIAIARFIDRFGTDPHTGIVTISSAGGPGVLAADEIIEAGLNLAALDPSTVTKLREVIPPFGNANNPLDLVADAGIGRYVDTIEIVRHDPNVSTILVIIVHPVLIETEPLLKTLDELNFPIIVAYLGPEFASFDHYDNLIVYQSTSQIIDILARINNYSSWKNLWPNLQKYPHLNPITPAPGNDKLDILLKSYGFSYPPTLHTSEYGHALEWFENLDQPVALKLSHSKFSHKTDSGGVLLNISTKEEFAKAWYELQDIYTNASIPDTERIVEIQRFYSGGIEVVLGIIFDQQFGHFLLIGTGGTLVELLDDTVFLPSPVSRAAVQLALQELKLSTLLSGYRGGIQVDTDKLIDQVLQLDNLIHHHPEISELDINPLYVLPETGEFVVLDARYELSNSSS